MKNLKNLNIRHSFFVFLTTFVLCMGNAGLASAWQVDPFDPFATDETDVQAPQESPTADTELSLDESLSNGVVLVIKSVHESNPTSPIDLARAVNTMITIEQYSEAQKYLDQLIATDASATQMFELSEEMGSPFWLELRSIPDLQPAGAEYAERVIRTARTEAYAPDRINQLISELSDANQFVRQGAARKLKLLGGPAVSIMLQVCENRKRRKEVPFVASALKQMGEPALFPLIGAARADSTVAQAVAAGALSNIDSALAVDALLRMSISAQVPETVREIAAEALAQRGLTSETAILNRIFDRANEYLEGNITIPSDINGQSKIWNWNVATGRLMATETTEANAVRIMAVDLARDAYLLKPDNREYRMLQLLAVLEATKRVLGPYREVRTEEVTRFIRDLNFGDLEIAMRQAQDRMLMPAAVGAAELIGQSSEASILIRNDGKHSTLVDAILSGHRQLQFAAAKAIADIDPKHAFPGCSYVAQYLTLLANSSGNSSGVAVHSKQDSAQALATSIFQTGRTGLTVNSSFELFQMLNSNPDVDFIVVTDTIARPHYQELVQKIRSYWISQHIPVALVIRTDERERQAKRVLEDDAMTLVMPFTLDARSVFAQVNRLIEKIPASAVSNVQRQLQKEFALKWLAKTLADPQSYGFYELSRYQDQLARTASLPGLVDSKSNILAHLGTPTSQRILVNLASDVGLPIADRNQMVDAFKNSVSQNGLLLTRNEINSQYNRYDSTRFDNDSSRKVLNAILEIIESHAASDAEKVSTARN